jgi:hypothetical protein
MVIFLKSGLQDPIRRQLAIAKVQGCEQEMGELRNVRRWTV